ncbi:MAG: hypothetical protein EBR82_57675 [Caulobacteraceae bacterium]|nr:hypothetical protein [Caulobacteraceae bacterium]
MDKAAAAALGARFGESIKDYTKASENIIEAIVIDHCNEGIKLMSKQIKSKARTGQASTLAASMSNVPIQISATKFQVNTISTEYYADFVDKGVKGVRNRGKAPSSPYSFKNLGTSKAMIESFKNYIARTGSKSMNKKTLIRKNKKKQSDLITKEAKQMAVATKIGGIKPMNFISKADNPQRTKQLAASLASALGKAMAKNIKISINGN